MIILPIILQIIILQILVGRSRKAQFTMSRDLKDSMCLKAHIRPLLGPSWVSGAKNLTGEASLLSSRKGSSQIGLSGPFGPLHNLWDQGSFILLFPHSCP